MSKMNVDFDITAQTVIINEHQSALQTEGDLLEAAALTARLLFGLMDRTKQSQDMLLKQKINNLKDNIIVVLSQL